MTYTIVALTNDKAQLIVSETRTTDTFVKELVITNLTARGYKVIVKEEN
jgi:hypothetical protein